MIKYAHPAEKIEVIKPLPLAQLKTELNRRRQELAAHLARRPGTQDLDERRRWVLAKDHLLTGIEILESQLLNRWHEVTAP